MIETYKGLCIVLCISISISIYNTSVLSCLSHMGPSWSWPYGSWIYN